MSATADYRADTTVVGRGTSLLKAPESAVSQPNDRKGTHQVAVMWYLDRLRDCRDRKPTAPAKSTFLIQRSIPEFP